MKPSLKFLNNPAFSWKNLLKRLLVWFLGGSIAWVFILKFLPVWFTPYMLFRKAEAAFSTKKISVSSTWKPMKALSKEAALAVVAAEDQHFFEHHGFDFNAMWNAFKYNFKGKRTRGASTISQQVAKNVFLWSSRSYLRKGLEVYFTLLIELIWGKERILEVYLNVAETSERTFGVEEASQQFFKKPAKNLTRQEAARIAAVLPNPVRFSIGKPSGYVRARTSHITRQMTALGGTSFLQFD